MTEVELIQLINKKRNELEYNRSSKVSGSLLRVQEEELEELEEIFATNDSVRMAKRVFVDQCQENVDETAGDT